MPAYKRRRKGSQTTSSYSSVASSKKKNKNIELPRAWLPPPSAPIPPGQPFLIQPDEYYPTTYSDSVHWNAVPVFKPTWEQFQDFFTYCQRIRPHGMQTGIVKIVPPQEWLDIQPDLTQRLEHIKIRRPLRQVVQPGGEGIYQQTNQPQRDCIFTVREWADMCASAEHRGPELKKIQDRLAQRYELLALQKTRSRRRPNRAQDEQGDDHPQEGEVSTSQLAEQQGSTSAPSHLLEISAESTPLPTPPPSIAIEPAFPRIEDDSLDATAETTSTEAPRHLTSAVHEPPSLLAQAEEETKPDLASVLSELDPPTAAAAAAAIHSTATSEPPITVKPDPEDEKKSGADPKWNYKTAWMYEYLPPKFAAQATDADWTIDVCSEIEIEYWRSLGSLRSGGGSVYGKSAAALKAAWYGADQSGTLFDDDMRVWNVGKLDNVLTRMLGCIDEDGHWRNLNLDPIAGEGEESKDTKSGKVKIDRKGKGKATEDDRPTASSSLDFTSASAIAGVTTPYLYFGQWQATFSWHIEDMDLCSINYIHFGAPKQWYAIPQSERNRFETVMQTFFPTDAHRCKQFLRHKSYLVNPARLASIKPLKLVQHAGEIVLTFPFGYHSGFNLGFNCAESTNFALDDWPQLGMEAQVCQCLDREKPVHINVWKLYREAMAAQEKEDGGEADDEGGARRERGILSDFDDDDEARTTHREVTLKKKKDRITSAERSSMQSSFKLKKRAPEFSDEGEEGSGDDDDDHDESPSRKRAKTMKLAAAAAAAETRTKTKPKTKTRAWTADELKTIQRARDMAPIFTRRVKGQAIRKSINQLKGPRAHAARRRDASGPPTQDDDDGADAMKASSSSKTRAQDDSPAPDTNSRNTQSNNAHSSSSFGIHDPVCRLDWAAECCVFRSRGENGRFWVGSEMEGGGATFPLFCFVDCCHVSLHL